MLFRPIEDCIQAPRAKSYDMTLSNSIFMLIGISIAQQDNISSLNKGDSYS